MARRDFFKTTQRKRYQSGSYRNPHTHTQSRSTWRFFVYPGVFLIALGGGLTFLFAHPWFIITEVYVSGIESIHRTDLEAVVSRELQKPRYIFFDQRNRFLFSSNALASSLETTFALARIDVGLREGGIYITLEERTSHLLWRTGGRVYVVDLEGIVVREVINIEDELLKFSNLSELPIFIDKNNVGVDVGDTALKVEEVENAFRFLSQLKELGIDAMFIDVDRVAGKWVRLVTQDKYSILFDMTGDVEAQAGHLRVVLEQIDDPSTLEYIDLRFGDKVYYK